MPDIHDHFCSFCPRWLGEGSALCQSCNRPMCAVCFAQSNSERAFPGKTGDDLLIYRPSFYGGEFKCVECRTAYAESELARYNELESVYRDPLWRVVDLTNQGFTVDLPDAPDHYNPIPSWLEFASEWQVSMISIPQIDTSDALHHVQVATLTGWRVRDGLNRRQHDTADYNNLGGGWNTYSADALVLQDGAWVEIDRHYLTRKESSDFPAPATGTAHELGDHRYSTDVKYFSLRPESFLEAARKLSRPRA